MDKQNKKRTGVGSPKVKIDKESAIKSIINFRQSLRTFESRP